MDCAVLCSLKRGYKAAAKMLHIYEDNSQILLLEHSTSTLD